MAKAKGGKKSTRGPGSKGRIPKGLNKRGRATAVDSADATSQDMVGQPLPGSPKI